MVSRVITIAAKTENAFARMDSLLQGKEQKESNGSDRLQSVRRSVQFGT